MPLLGIWTLKLFFNKKLSGGAGFRAMSKKKLRYT